METLKFKLLSDVLNRYLSYLVYIIIFAIPIIDILILFDIIRAGNLLDKIKIVFSSFIGIGIGVAFISYRENYIWNKRKFSFESMKKILEEVTELKSKISPEHRKYIYEKIENKSRLSVAEIHDMLCEKDFKGRYVISNSSKYFKMTREGENTRRIIIAVINCYEALAMGIYYGMYDEYFVFAYSQEMLISDYLLLSNYIIHLQKDHGLKDIGYHFIYLGLRWEKKAISPKEIERRRKKLNQLIKI